MCLASEGIGRTGCGMLGEEGGWVGVEDAEHRAFGVEGCEFHSSL